MALTKAQIAERTAYVARSRQVGGRAATAEDRENYKGNTRREISRRAADPKNTGRNR